jgi:hypothetical protein
VGLGRPSTALVHTLIDKLLPQSSPHHRDITECFVRESFFGAVLVCTILSRERNPLKQSRARICAIGCARAVAVGGAGVVDRGDCVACVWPRPGPALLT